MNLLDQVLEARQKSVPLIAITTPDPAATIRTIAAFHNDPKNDKNCPLIQWDCVRGLIGMNDLGIKATNRLMRPVDDEGQEPEDISGSINLTDMLHRAGRIGKTEGKYVGRLPSHSIIFVMNIQLALQSDGAVGLVQAIWNCRDPFKMNFRSLVLLTPGWIPPRELADDILPLEEPLPKVEELRTIILSQYKSVKQAVKSLPDLTDPVLDKAVDALRGLAAFPAEQVTVMALTTKGLNLDMLWERKRKMIELTPGLSVWRGGEKFSDIGGLGNLKQFLGRVLHGAGAPRCIVFIDEIEKAFAGATGPIGDSSGVSQAMLGILLSYMQDTNAAGLMLVGPAGTGKSLIAKAAGSEAGIPTVYADLSGMKNALVGESETNLRRALRVVTAISDSAALFIATSNSVSALPPELRRRFQLGTVFVDLLSKEERAPVWKMYLSKYKLDEQPIPPSEGWTGAEIKACCDIAWRLSISLLDASKYVVPIAVSAKELVQRLRQTAANRFISASYPGLYQYKPIKEVEEVETIPFEPSERGYAVN